MSDDLNIVTNNIPRDVIRWDDLTDDERANFDYLTTDDERAEFTGFRYRGSTYDLGDGFERAPHTIARHGFDGWQTSSCFDGIAVRYFDRDGELLDDGDAIVVAHVHW